MTNIIPHTRGCLPTPFITTHHSEWRPVRITYLILFKCIFTIELPSLLVQCSACQVDIELGKGVYFFLHVRIAVWIDLGAEAPPECLSRFGN